MKEITIPRRLFIRSILKGLTHLALNLFSDFELIGEENIPDEGPIIITGNHFSFADSVALLRIAPPSLEVFTGAILLPGGQNYFLACGEYCMFTGVLDPDRRSAMLKTS